MFSCQEIKDKKLWDNFITSQPNHTFLHSWAWGEFNEAMGDKVWRLGVYSPPYKGGDRGGHLVAATLVIKVHARRGKFLFIPHGPIGDRQALALFVDKLKELARRERVSFIRISPILEDTEENKTLFRDLGFRPAPIHIHAETTWTLDLSPNEDNLLMAMRKTTRNLIRKAAKEGVKITTGINDGDIEIFNNLYQKTVKRHNFSPFSLAYLRNQVKVFEASAAVRIFTAWHNDQPLVSAIVVFYGTSAFYHHGASVPNKIPAAYLLQWEAIKEAKRRGHKFYNFWGIIKGDASAHHPWQGITLFKKGFGGFETDYLHAQDMSLSWKYWPNWLVETARRIRRRL